MHDLQKSEKDFAEIKALIRRLSKNLRFKDGRNIDAVREDMKLEFQIEWEEAKLKEIDEAEIESEFNSEELSDSEEEKVVPEVTNFASIENMEPEP